MRLRATGAGEAAGASGAGDTAGAAGAMSCCVSKWV
jgi:hypothetical protein